MTGVKLACVVRLEGGWADPLRVPHVQRARRKGCDALCRGRRALRNDMPVLSYEADALWLHDGVLAVSLAPASKACAAEVWAFSDEATGRATRVLFSPREIEDSDKFRVEVTWFYDKE